MSFGLPSVKVKPERLTRAELEEGPYGVPSPLTAGLTATRATLGAAHPLQFSEKNYQLHQDRMNMQVLRNVQGLHAPMRLTMELKAANKVGRLPFLPSSNLQREVLTGRHLDIGFEDFLNTAEFREVAPPPHAAVERQLHIL